MSTISPNKLIASQYLLQVGENQNLDILYDIIHPEYLTGDTRSVSQVSTFLDQDQLDKIGPAGVIERFESIFKWGNFSIEVQDIVEEGNLVFVNYFMTVHHIGELMGFAPTGKKIRLKGHHLFEFKDGKIINIQLLWDWLKFLQETGLAVMQEDDQEKTQKYIDNLRALNILP